MILLRADPNHRNLVDVEQPFCHQSSMSGSEIGLKDLIFGAITKNARHLFVLVRFVEFYKRLEDFKINSFKSL